MAGVEVLHEHEGHAGVDRQRPQDLSECVQPAGGGPHADDGKGALRRTILDSFVPLTGRGLGRRFR